MPEKGEQGALGRQGASGTWVARLKNTTTGSLLGMAQASRLYFQFPSE